MLRQVLIIFLISKTIFAYTSAICAQVPDGHFVRSSKSCNSYNRCINGQAMHGMCPKGFSFSPLSQTCNHNIDVDCQSCSPHGIQNIAYPDNCSWYYRCVNGVRTTMSCSDGLLFDRSYGDCNIAQRVVCETKNTICEPFAQLAWLGAILIGNPLDCSSYYYCINGNAIEAVCPNGLYYNPHTAICEVRDTNFCQGTGPLITTPIPEFTTREGSSTPSTTSTTVRIIYFTTVAPGPTESSTLATSSTTTTSTSTTTTSTSTTTTSAPTEEITEEVTEEVTEEITEEVTEETTEETTTSATPPPPPVLTCEENFTGYLPFPPPDNCKRYYYCSRGVLRYQYTCYDGQFFTPGNNQCTADVPPGCEYLVE